MADRYEKILRSPRATEEGGEERGSRASSPPKIQIRSKKDYEPTRISPAWRRRLHERFGDEPLQLIFSPTSCAKTQRSIFWGMRDQKNVVEQGGILLGQVFRYRDEIFCFIEDTILSETRGQRTSVEISTDSWVEVYRELDRLNGLRGARAPLRVVGWFHTHPNGLDAFMSGTDRDTQKKQFPEDWQAALVIDPHLKTYRVYFGRDIREGSVKGWDTDCEVQDVLYGLSMSFQ